MMMEDKNPRFFTSTIFRITLSVEDHAQIIKNMLS